VGPPFPESLFCGLSCATLPLGPIRCRLQQRLLQVRAPNAPSITHSGPEALWGAAGRTLPQDKVAGKRLPWRTRNRTPVRSKPGECREKKGPCWRAHCRQGLLPMEGQGQGAGVAQGERRGRLGGGLGSFPGARNAKAIEECVDHGGRLADDDAEYRPTIQETTEKLRASSWASIPTHCGGQYPGAHTPGVGRVIVGRPPGSASRRCPASRCGHFQMPLPLAHVLAAGAGGVQGPPQGLLARKGQAACQLWGPLGLWRTLWGVHPGEALQGRPPGTSIPLWGGGRGRTGGWVVPRAGPLGQGGRFW